MGERAIPPLSKTRYIGGLQCHKRAYLEAYHRELIPPVGMAQQALFDSGTTVGELARELFQNGLLITANHLSHGQAVTSTKQAIIDTSVRSIYEAAFTFDDIRTRVDILKKLHTNAFVLGEVKSSTRVKKEHIPDAAIQVYVAEGSGLDILNIYLIHINNSYVYQGGEYELNKLFHLEEITAEVREYMATSLSSDLAGIRHALAQGSVPEIEIGRHCTRPYECPFYSHCRQYLPHHHIEQIPGARADLLGALKAAGVTAIAEIFTDFPGLSALQRRVRNSVVSGEPYIDRKLASNLNEVVYPLRYLDFESFNPALPHYPGTRPYQVIPFQWSMHVQQPDGTLDHHEFLHDGTNDPRPGFITSLLEAAGDTGSIVAYSAYEETRLKQLANEFPKFAEGLLALIPRIYDLLKVIRADYYHPEFHGSFSLKSVLPVLVPELSYEDLDITDGSIASVAFAKMIYPKTGQLDANRLRSALLDYCRRDTEAMVRVRTALKSLKEA
jgi:hypothetical protein